VDFARDGRGVYHVRLGYDDDLVALASLKSAARIVDWLVGRTGEQPDVGAIVAEIRAVRAPSAEGAASRLAHAFDRPSGRC